MVRVTIFEAEKEKTHVHPSIVTMYSILIFDRVLHKTKRMSKSMFAAQRIRYNIRERTFCTRICTIDKIPRVCTMYNVQIQIGCGLEIFVNHIRVCHCNRCLLSLSRPLFLFIYVFIFFFYYSFFFTTFAVYYLIVSQ